MAMIRVTTPLHVRIVVVKECMGDHRVKFLFALMAPLASMNIKVLRKVVATLFTPVFTVDIVTT
jgi:hypothetical protein